MVAGFNGNPLSRAEAECVGPSKCERINCKTTSDFFPQTACAELEVKMAFPSCWDGVNIDSEDHQSHVSYDMDGGRFDGDCPASHPIKIPEIQFYFRIVPYSGGQHIFAGMYRHRRSNQVHVFFSFLSFINKFIAVIQDGTDYYHSDYFSGWDENELQDVLVSINISTITLVMDHRS